MIIKEYIFYIKTNLNKKKINNILLILKTFFN